MNILRRIFIPVAVGLVILAAPARVQAHDNGLMGGVRLGYYTDAGEPFVGAELLAHVDGRIYFNPNVEYVFTNNLRYITLNADFHYDFPRHHDTYFWLGGGLAVISLNPEGPPEGDTDLGANIFAGAGLRAGGVIPYVQFKVIAKDNAEAVLAVGLRF